MNEEAAFLNAIFANPDDDAPRLIYADWLEERDDPKGEFIRLQCKHANQWFQALSISGDKDCARMEYLEKTHGASWVQQAPKLPGLNWRLWRGFPSWIHVQSWQALSQHLQVIFQAAPVEYLTIERLNLAGARALAKSPYLERIRVLDLAYGAIGTLGALRALLASPALAKLQTLRLFHSNHGDALAIELAKCPYLSGLKLLSLYSSEVDDAGAYALARSPYLKTVGFIELSRNRFGDDAEAELEETFGDRINT